MSRESRYVRCPRCRTLLEWDVEWWEGRYSLFEARRAELESHLRASHRDEIVSVRRLCLIQESGIPDRFRWAMPRPPDDPGAAAWQEAAEWYGDCFGDSNLIIYGPTGVGKSTLAARLLLQRVEEGADMELTETALSWLHVGDFARRARRLLATGRSAELSDILECAQEAWVLVLDDLGAERVTDYARDLVADLIESRYDARRTMIVTSNFAPDELAARLAGDDPIIGDRLVGRLCEDAEQIHFRGADRRLPDEAAA